MRWWLRILVTLVLAPILWQLAAVYVGSAQGGALDALITAATTTLPKTYLIYTLPALAVIVIVLLPADRLLALVGADLLVVVVAPLVLSGAIHDPRLDAAGLRGLAFAYGLVFGLTVREPRTTPRRQAATQGSANP